MQRQVKRTTPDGIERMLSPFHVSWEGLENAVLFRDDEDYDVAVKQIAICARRTNVLVIIYAVVSNHVHVGLLAAMQKDADVYAQELKRVYSMWFSRKYHEKSILHGTDAKAILLDSDWYVRNALAYIPRNALDNGCSVQEYRWSGFRAMFREKPEPGHYWVGQMTKRERERLLHTADNLRQVPWQLDSNGFLIPGSFCDAAYLEQVFNHAPAFFLKTIGTLNPAEMEEKLIAGPRRKLPDSAFYKEVADMASRWFSQDLGELTLEKKKRLLPYIWRTRKTTVNQLARIFDLTREEVRDALRLGKVSG